MEQILLEIMVKHMESKNVMAEKVSSLKTNNAWEIWWPSVMGLQKQGIRRVIDAIYLGLLKAFGTVPQSILYTEETWMW